MSTVLVEDALEYRRAHRRSTRATTMSCQYLVMLSRRTTSAAPDMDLLNERILYCCIKRVKRNMESTQPFMRDGSAATDTESRCRTMDGRRATSCYLTELPWKNHKYTATRAERIRHSEHWVLKLNQDGPEQPLNQRPDLAQAKRECKRLHDEYMARTQQEYRTIPRSQQVRQRKEQQFEGIEEYDYAVDPRTGWRSINSTRETSRLRRHRPRPRIGKATVGRREVGIPGILHGLTILDVFPILRPVSVGREINFPTTSRGVDRQHTSTRHV